MNGLQWRHALECMHPDCDETSTILVALQAKSGHIASDTARSCPQHVGVIAERLLEAMRAQLVSAALDLEPKLANSSN